MNGSMKPYDEMTDEDKARVDAIMRRLNRELHDALRDYEDQKAKLNADVEEALKQAGLWIPN